MRFVYLVGGFIGFSLAALTGLAAGRASGPVLRDAAFGCLVGAALFRWFWSVVERALAETLERRREEARLRAAEPSTPKPPAATPTPAPAAVRSR